MIADCYNSHTRTSSMPQPYEILLWNSPKWQREITWAHKTESSGNTLPLCIRTATKESRAAGKIAGSRLLHDLIPAPNPAEGSSHSAALMTRYAEQAMEIHLCITEVLAAMMTMQNHTLLRGRLIDIPAFFIFLTILSRHPHSPLLLLRYQSRSCWFYLPYTSRISCWIWCSRELGLSQTSSFGLKTLLMYISVFSFILIPFLGHIYLWWTKPF